MRKSQLLELIFGFATLAASIEHYFNIELPAIMRSSPENQPRSIYFTIIISIIPAFLIAFGALAHVLRNSFAGNLLLIIGSCILFVFYIAGFFGALYFYGGLFGALRYSILGIIAFTNLCFAFYSSKQHE